LCDGSQYAGLFRVNGSGAVRNTLIAGGNEHPGLCGVAATVQQLARNPGNHPDDGKWSARRLARSIACYIMTARGRRSMVPRMMASSRTIDRIFICS